MTPPLRGKPASGRSNLADAELAALAQSGDRAAFGELVRRHGSGVRALLRRMGADPAAADDLAQDAFLLAYERIAELRGQGQFPAWVKKIAARLYLRQRRRPGWLALEGEAADESSTAQSRTGADQRLDLDEALQRLSPAERVCVSLCCGAGFSHAEAAEALKAPLGTVKSHVRRGLDRLRAQLGPETGATGG